MMIFRSLEFPCDGAVLNVSMAMNVTVQEERGIELQIWRFYPNDSVMLVQWVEPKRIECIGCSKHPMYLSQPLSFGKGDVLGITLKTDQTNLSYVNVGSLVLPVVSTEVILLFPSDVEKIHEIQGEVVTRDSLSNYSDLFGNRIVKQYQVSPLIELELSRELPLCVCTAKVYAACSGFYDLAAYLYSTLLHLH